MNCLFEAGIIDWIGQQSHKKKINILGIGAGYGGFARSLKSILPRATYWICDIPESLLFSSVYLGATSPEYQHAIYDGNYKADFFNSDGGFKYIPNFMFDDLVQSGTQIDLAINMCSFIEMSEKQIRYYAANIQKLLGGQGVLFDLNQRISAPTSTNHDAKTCIADYFKYSKNLRPKSIPLLKRGVATVWGSRPIPEIIDPSFKPFTGIRWSLYWMVYAVRNWRVYGSDWKLSGFEPLRPLLGEKLYGMTLSAIRRRRLLRSFLSARLYDWLKSKWNRSRSS